MSARNGMGSGSFRANDESSSGAPDSNWVVEKGMAMSKRCSNPASGAKMINIVFSGVKS